MEDLNRSLEIVVRAMERVDEDVYILRLRRPWFWRLRVWACQKARRALEREATDITDRIRFRRGLP